MGRIALASQRNRKWSDVTVRDDDVQRSTELMGCVCVSVALIGQARCGRTIGRTAFVLGSFGRSIFIYSTFKKQVQVEIGDKLVILKAIWQDSQQFRLRRLKLLALTFINPARVKLCMHSSVVC